MEIRELALQDIVDVVSLVDQVFMKFVSREETKEGIENFKHVNTKEFYIQETVKTYVIEKENKIVGMVSINTTDHIHLLFVDPNYQRQGIARALLEKVMTITKDDITVNSSLYAYHFYRAMGFHSTNIMQEKDGITFIPMVKRKDV